MCQSELHRSCGAAFAIAIGRKDESYVQRSIEIVIGRLTTDEEFRAAFVRDPRAALQDAAQWGLTLSLIEVAALMATDRSLWDRVAVELDSRLQKVSLKAE